MMDPLAVLAGRVSSLDAVLVALAWCVMQTVTRTKEVRTANARLALLILAGLGAGLFLLRLLMFAADRRWI